MIFLKDNYADRTAYYAINPTQISTLPYADTYDRNGQLVDADEDDKTAVTGFNYWDGNNNHTVTVASNEGPTSHDIVKDEALISELNEAIASMKLIESGHGLRSYTTDTQYVVIESDFARAWWRYEIVPVMEA